MEISEIKQNRNGRQEKPYAPHVWEWTIKAYQIKDKEDVLTFAQQYLKRCKYDKETYYNLYRDNSLSFLEHMTVVCEGYYELYRNNDTTWTYRVEQEYID